MDSLYRSTPRQARSHIAQCLDVGLVPFIQSSPGMGKSSIVRSIAEEANLKLIDLRLSTCAPEDLSGLPRFNNDRAEFVPFKDFFPLEEDALPHGKNGWLLFLDEFNSASKSVQASCYKLILDRMTGLHKLHDAVYIVAAGNLDSDRAITNSMSTAMQSRLIHIEMECNFNEWLEDVAIKEGYDSRIIGFLSMYPTKLMNFDPKHQDKTFCCPRTWEFVNKLIKGNDVNQSYGALLAGTITSGVAAEFIQFCQIYAEMISLSDILKDPEGCRLPSDASMKWATTAHLLEKTDRANFEKISTYMDRFSIDFRILFYRALLIQMPEIREDKKYIASMIALSKYIHS